MKNHWMLAAALAVALIPSGFAYAKVAVGDPAPAISVTDASGKAVNLADYQGKYVVLEWVNPACPFVQKHYDSGNMESTQAKAMESGAVWLAIQTTGEDAAKTAESLQSWQKSKNSAPTATLVDDGSIGRAYGARTTPHMYIVDPEGKLVYIGAIDSVPSADADDIAGATNYVTQGLSEAMAGQPISQPTTQPYGCSVKYPAGA